MDLTSILMSVVGPGTAYALRSKGALIAVGGGVLAAYVAGKFLPGLIGQVTS